MVTLMQTNAFVTSFKTREAAVAALKGVVPPFMKIECRNDGRWVIACYDEETGELVFCL